HEACQRSNDRVIAYFGATVKRFGPTCDPRGSTVAAGAPGVRAIPIPTTPSSCPATPSARNDRQRGQTCCRVPETHLAKMADYAERRARLAKRPIPVERVPNEPTVSRPSLFAGSFERGDTRRNLAG